MPSFVYAPGVRVHIESAREGTVDVSEDLTQGQLILRENAPHTFSFGLQNAQRKYDGVFLPMDKIIVHMKRLTWLPVMTGYLNSAPIFQAWPGQLSLSATCTLKKPQFWYWDPTVSASLAMVMNAMGQNSDSRAVQGDSGLSVLIRDALEQVTGWDRNRIHIGQIPKKWYDKFALPVAKAIGADEAMYQQLGSGYIASGNVPGAPYALKPGNYGAGIWPALYHADTDQAANATTIFATIRSMGITNDYVPTMALMCAMDESQLKNLANPNVPGSLDLPHQGEGTDHDSVGLFQQRVKYYTLAKGQDPILATKAFVKGLLSKINEAHPPSPSQYGATIQSWQVSGTLDGSNYEAYLVPALAMVDSLNKISQAVSSSVPVINGTQIGPQAGSIATGFQVAKEGLILMDYDAKHPIAYHWSGDDAADTPLDQVKTLDCSSLIDWVYYHATGKWLSGTKGQRTVVSDILARSKTCPVEIAAEIQGAVLIEGPDSHVGLSLGNGKTHIAAHTDNAPLPDQVSISPISGNGFNVGGLLPQIDYSSSATTARAMKWLNDNGVKVIGKAPQLTDVNDPTLPNDTTAGTIDSSNPFASLVNNLLVGAPSDQSGLALAGPVALINDQPFLPWLQSIVNASMRSFCSSPTGDFIAWFPDYFGVWGTAGVMQIEPIELQNFEVDWSDQQIVTHQFVLGSVGASLLDPTSGSVGATGPTDLLSLALGTAGIASMDYPEIFKAVYGETAPKHFVHSFLSRFGARPDVQQMPNIPKGNTEFFMALYLFMQRWAAQFSTSIPLTFMPELFPGMLMQIPHFGFQAYVQQVVHTFQFGDGGGFNTSASVCAPSNIGGRDRTDLLSLLPSPAEPVKPQQKSHRHRRPQRKAAAS